MWVHTIIIIYGGTRGDLHTKSVEIVAESVIDAHNAGLEWAASRELPKASVKSVYRSSDNRVILSKGGVLEPA